MENKKKRDAIQASRVLRIAEKMGVSKRHVYRVIKGQCENEEILAMYITLCEMENEIIDEVRRIVPVTNQ